MSHILKVVQIPTKKHGWTFYWYDKYYGLNQYSAEELTEMSKDGVKIVIVDSLEELGVYEN